MEITLFAIVMAFGAMVAIAGLILLFVRKEQAENAITVFGWQFKISTPALVVFLAGAAIFILPLVLPIQNQPVINFGSSGQIDPHIVNPSKRGKRITDANPIKMGMTVQGLIATDQDRDFYQFKTSGQELKVRVILRKPMPGGFYAIVNVYDSVEKLVTDSYQLGESAVSFSFDSNANSTYYIMVEGGGSGSRGPYELLVKAE